MYINFVDFSSAYCGTNQYVPEGTITVQDSDLYLYIPEGIITVRDSDLCHVLCSDPFGATVIQTGSMSSTQTGPRYLYLYATTTVSSLLASLSIHLPGHKQAIGLYYVFFHVLYNDIPYT